MQLSRDAAGLNGDQIAADAVHDRLKDGDAVEAVDGAVENDAAEAADNHGHQDRCPTFIEDFFGVRILLSYIDANGHEEEEDADEDGRQPLVLVEVGESADAKPESNNNVVRSPNEAAIGVATLSGSIWKRLEQMTTPTVMRPSMSEANEAVARLAAQSNNAWSKWNFPS